MGKEIQRIQLFIPTVFNCQQNTALADVKAEQIPLKMLLLRGNI